eukprot:TRINITY_DN3954_c0_g1_i1.p1 TRINITY_DN3954_c0_g1~~TRINITY_DN3954_c0_g1_i1.p1  ORF type:complete len:283 (+),score=89.70 TRINITY_DN3954_c0_g1_i1:337-1185(+)
MQGMIGCANVLSDLYAMGVVNCDNILMILAASNEMQKEERTIATRLMIKGFNDQAIAAETAVTGGQTVINPWPIIGGAATSVCTQDEFIMPDAAQVGDVLVLTKPIGIQIAVNIHQWRNLPAKVEQWAKLMQFLTEEQVETAYRKAMKSMARLNRNGAKLMHVYEAHGATDVTGFGLIGHAQNLVRNQKNEVDFEIERIPIFKDLKLVDEKVNSWSLLKGTSAETSGGLLIAMSPDKAQSFCEHLEKLDGVPAWIIGKVVPVKDTVKGRHARIVDNVEVLEI